MTNLEKGVVKLRFEPGVKILSAEVIGRRVEELEENNLLEITRDSSGNQEIEPPNNWITEVIFKRPSDGQPRALRVVHDRNKEGELHYVEEGNIVMEVSDKFRFETVIGGVKAKLI